MRIVSADVIVTSPGRNFVTLKLVTDEGIAGIGDATLNGRELAVASYLRDHVCPLLLERDAGRIEDTWQYLYRGAYWRRGPVTMAAIAAVDMALWDIKGKAAGMPVYQLLGGASRDGLLAYGHASGGEIPDVLNSVEEHLAKGFRAIRVQTGIPGLGSVYGVASSARTGPRYDYEPARRTPLPVEERWDTAAYMRHLPKVMEAVRTRFGDDLPLLHDGHHRMTPIQAAHLAKSLEPFRLFWLEDCTPAENQEGLRLVRRHSTTPLAIGEVFNSVFDYQTLITEQLIDYVRSAVTHAGGSRGSSGSSTSRASTRSSPASMGPRTSHPWAWRRRSTSVSLSTTSASRSTCSTARRRSRSSGHRSRSRRACSIPATSRGWASSSTRRPRRATRTSRRISPSRACATGPSTTGNGLRTGPVSRQAPAPVRPLHDPPGGSTDVTRRRGPRTRAGHPPDPCQMTGHAALATEDVSGARCDVLIHARAPAPDHGDRGLSGHPSRSRAPRG